MVDLIAVMLDFRQIRCLLQFDFDWSGEHLLASQHYGVFDGCVEITPANFRPARAGCFQEISESAADSCDFQANIFYHGTGRAGGGQITSHNFYHAPDSS